MAIQRNINFVGAMHELRAERHTQREPLRTPSGSFNRRAIMREATRQAKRIRSLTPWPVRVGLCLRGVWQQARLQGKPVPRRPLLPNPRLVLEQDAAVRADVTLAEFLARNLLADRDGRAILAALARQGVYFGGGGAVPAFTLRSAGARP